MEASKVIKRIKLYQNNPVFHLLTCGTNSQHDRLEPTLKDENIVLICPDCDYVQENIPDYFYYEEFEEEFNKQIDFLKKFHDYVEK